MTDAATEAARGAPPWIPEIRIDVDTPAKHYPKLLGLFKHKLPRKRR